MLAKANNHFSLSKTSLYIITILFIIAIIAPISEAALPDYLFISINGDTTGSTLTQGDEIGWGSNCDMGATINWEIWFDVLASLAFVLGAGNLLRMHLKKVACRTLKIDS